MTVYENVAFVLRVIDAPAKYIRSRVPYVISLVGLSDKAKSYRPSFQAVSSSVWH